MIKFRATKKQIKEMAALAVNASKPVGMGNLHYDEDKEFRPDEFKIPLYLDYVQGRCVKLSVTLVRSSLFSKKTLWKSSDFPPDKYNTWSAKYPNYTLLEKVGAEITEKDI